MKITFPLPTDATYHQYCPNCTSEEINRIFEGDKTFYFCDSCQKKHERMIVIDPGIIWWVDDNTSEYWHESVGVFITNKKNQILFFERTIFPFAHSIPAGHLDTGESPLPAAIREVQEETGLTIENLTLKSEEDVIGDKCRRGADNHKWHLYTASIGDSENVVINDEGKNPAWLTIEEVLEKDLTFAARFFIEKYGESLFK